MRAVKDGDSPAGETLMVDMCFLLDGRHSDSGKPAKLVELSALQRTNHTLNAFHPIHFPVNNT